MPYRHMKITIAFHMRKQGHRNGSRIRRSEIFFHLRERVREVQTDFKAAHRMDLKLKDPE